MPQDNSESPGCAIALIVIGLLVLVPSGLCTAVMGFSSWDSLAVALSIGGPFIVVGGGLVLGGIAWLRSVDKAPPGQGPPP